MASIRHVYRRGHIFWWRRVLCIADESSCDIRLSLRTADRRRARELGAMLTAASGGVTMLVEERVRRRADERPSEAELQAIAKAEFQNQLAAQRARMRAVINMDMIGVLNTQAPSVLIEGEPASRPLIHRLAAAAATYTDLRVETSPRAANSDHVPFLDRNLPAVLTIEGADASNGAIHSDEDILHRINLHLALEVLRMNTAALAELLA